MSDSASFYDRFFMDVSVGFLLTILGAVLLLAAAVGTVASTNLTPRRGGGGWR